MGQQGNQRSKCQQEVHQDDIDTICYNQFCTDFRLNCFQCIQQGMHSNHITDVGKINTLIDFIQIKNKECDNLIDDLNKQVERANESFSQLKRGIRYKYQLMKERLDNMNPQQVNDFLNSTTKLTEYKQSITSIILEQTKKLTHSFNNLYEQLALSSCNYYQVDNNEIKLSKELYEKSLKLKKKKKYHDAIVLLDKSIQYNPKNHLSLWCKGSCLSDLQEYNKAINWFDKALSIDSQHLNSLLNKGILKDSYIIR